MSAASLKKVPAVRIENSAPVYTNIDLSDRQGVRIDVVSASICGSDLHMTSAGWAEGRVLGHEFAGRTADGRAVAIEPLDACGHCRYCEDGQRSHCENGADIVGVSLDGGMARYAIVPESTLVPLPSGLDISIASLVEPLAVALHGLNRARWSIDDKVLIVGAGPIGLMCAAAIAARGGQCAITARHDHQRIAAEKLRASSDVADGYDLVFDAVGTTDSLAQAVQFARPQARIGMLGSFWSPVQVDFGFCGKEIELIAATMYQRCAAGDWEFREAVEHLAKWPAIADALITHRFPLEAAPEAFAVANDRAAGAIKVVFDAAE